MEKQTKFNLWYALFALFAVMLLHDMWTAYRTVEPLPYSEFQRLLKDGQIQDMQITANHIQGELKNALPDGRKRFVTTRVDPELAKDLSQFDVKYTGIVENTLLRDVLGWVIP